VLRIRQITFQADPHGGAFFPGLAKPVVIDPASLDAAEAARLQTLVDEAHFFEQPAEVGMRKPGMADYRVGVLAIDDGTCTHTVRALMPIADHALRTLFDAVEMHVKAARAAQKANAGRKPGG